MKNSPALIFKTLNQDAHWNVNKAIAKEYGIVPACLLAHLISLSVKSFRSNEFYQKQEILMKTLNVSRRELENSLKVLLKETVSTEEDGSGNKVIKTTIPLLSVVKKGTPCKSYYTILWENIVSVLETPIEEDEYGDGQDRSNVADYTAINERTKKKKEEKKKEKQQQQNDSSNEYSFNEPNKEELVRKHKEITIQKEIEWEVLNSVWTTQEYSSAVKSYKKDWMKLTIDQQLEIINFCKEHQHKFKMTNVWKKDFFRTNNSSLNWLENQIKNNKTSSASKPGMGLTDFNNL